MMKYKKNPKRKKLSFRETPFMYVNCVSNEIEGSDPFV